MSSNVFDSIKNEVQTEVLEVFSFFKQLVTANVVALVPVAKQAIAGLIQEEVKDVASGNTANTGHTLADAVKATEAAAIQAGITATSGEILTAVGVAKSSS